MWFEAVASLAGFQVSCKNCCAKILARISEHWSPQELGQKKTAGRKKKKLLVAGCRWLRKSLGCVCVVCSLGWREFEFGVMFGVLSFFFYLIHDSNNYDSNKSEHKSYHESYGTLAARSASHARAPIEPHRSSRRS